MILTVDIPVSLHRGQGKLHDQIRSGIQDLVTRGVLPSGTRLPPVRILALQLRVNPRTVLRAYRELESMGYLDLDIGIGTFVSRRIPDPFLSAAPAGRRAALAHLARVPPPSLSPLPRPSSRPRFATVPTGARVIFRAGAADHRLFPVSVWRRLHDRHLRQERGDILGAGWTLGRPDLLAALREKILPARGIVAEPDGVMVFSGGMTAIRSCLRLLARPGRRIALEDPAHALFHAMAVREGGSPVPIPVDRGGLDVRALSAALTRKKAGIVLLTPSHQFPTGATLDFGRRREILAAAAGRDAWILEDDYDSEFHYDSPPLPSLRSMDVSGQVIYVGTFSKSLFYGVRLGFVVAAPSVIEGLMSLARDDGMRVPHLLQQVLADFIREGHYDHHIRRMRRIHAARRDAMAAALRRHLPDFTFDLPSGGVRLWVRLPKGVSADRLTERLARRGVYVQAPGIRFVAGRLDRFLPLGFAATNEADIETGIREMKRAASRTRGD